MSTAPTIRARMQRRILVNYRVEAEALASFLPPPFRPVLVGDHGVAGICLIRLGAVRPVGMPPALGLTSENAAHRVAVEWDTPDGPTTGVYIPRRDSSSRLAVLLGGRAFPGLHHRAQFRVEEGNGGYRVEMASRDGEVQLAVAAHPVEEIMSGSVLGSLEEASAFFRSAPLGYSATTKEGAFDGVELTTDHWSISPLHLDQVRSSFFDDPVRFGRGAAVPDSAFLMSDLDTTWRAWPTLRASAGGPTAPSEAEPARP